MRIVILGCGNVGGTLASLILAIASYGWTLHKVVVKNRDKPRRAEFQVPGSEAKWESLQLPGDLISTDAESAVLDPKVDVVIDATAADTTALLLRAISAGKHVVSANKRMVARDGAMLMDAAKAARVNFLFEATVMAKVPIISIARLVNPLQAQQIHAIVSGTCALILRSMRNDGITFYTALVEAKDAGYAEANPTADIDAHDSSAKVRILAHSFLNAPSLTRHSEAYVLREGIRGLPEFAHRFAAACGHVVELVASAFISGEKVGMMVMPTLVPKREFLGGLRGVENGILIQDLIGPPLEFAGPGAGGLATAAAILMDLMATDKPSVNNSSESNRRSLLDPERLRFRSVFISASPETKRAVLSEKLRVLADVGLSVEQIGNDPDFVWPEGGETVSYDAIACEMADYEKIRRGREALSRLECVGHRPVFLLRAYGDSPLSYSSRQSAKASGRGDQRSKPGQDPSDLEFASL